MMCEGTILRKVSNSYLYLVVVNHEIQNNFYDFEILVACDFTANM